MILTHFQPKQNNFILNPNLNINALQIQATAPSIVTLPEKNEQKLFVNGAEVSDGKPVTISKIEIIENKSAAPASSSADAIKLEPFTSKTEETNNVPDKDSFIVTPDYIQQSMLIAPSI